MSKHQYVYFMQELKKSYPGGREVLKGVTLQFLPNAKIGILGMNGAGKSTLLKIMAGELEASSGEAYAAKGVKVGYLPQEPKLDESLNVRENVMLGLAEIAGVVQAFNDISMKMAEPMTDDEMMALIDQQADLQEKIDASDAWDLDQRVDMAMDALRCPEGDSETANLSGGERRRVALCRLLLEKPDVLLLDEPTNHLDALTIAWLQKYLADYTGMVMMVTHDRYFLDHVTSWILELDRGSGIPYEGNYSSWLEQKEKRLLQEGREEEARLRSMRNEKEWIDASPRARQAKSKARISSYEEKLAQSETESRSTAEIVIPSGPRLGGNVLEVKGLTKAFGDKLLINDLNFILPPGGVVGVIGANGAGKSTFLKMITDQETPDSGTLKVGETVALGYVDQSRDSLDDKSSVWEAISDGQDVIELGKIKRQSRAYVGSFNFKGADQEKKVGILSGGERNRVHLARMLKSGANVLLLDEPTNDLDVETLRALETALENFAGSVIIVSHDRWFLDRIVTHILAFEGDSHVEWFEGSYRDYEADFLRRTGKDALIPERIKFRRFTRD